MSYLTNSSSAATTAQSKPAATGSAEKLQLYIQIMRKRLSAYVTAEKETASQLMAARVFLNLLIQLISIQRKMLHTIISFFV